MVEASKDEQLYLVFKNIRSVIRPSRKGDKFVFKNVPKPEEARIVAIQVEEGQANLDYIDLTIGKAKDIQINYKKADLNSIKRVFTEFEAD